MIDKEIKKLIKQYELKVHQMDILLESIQNKKREIRHQGTTVDNYEFQMLSSERKMYAAQRQSYVQAIADFESLLDYV